MKYQARMMIAVATLSGAAVAQTVPADQNAFYGSDTLNQLLDLLIPNLDVPEIAPAGIDRNYGIGGLAGQRQMEGSPLAGEPTCGWTGSGSNPGCQEIAPMVGLMTSDICNDQEAASNAESLLVAKDALVLLANNLVHRQYSAGTCAPGDTTPARLRSTGTLNDGYVLGSGYPGSEWKDALRLLLTGCKAADGDCTKTVARSVRCNNAARRELLAAWSQMLDGQNCATGTCSDVKHLFRRDDAGGATVELLKLIGVDPNGFKARTSVLNGGGFPSNIGPVPEDFPFCDGGMDENYNASTNGSDPVRATCDASADLCDADGKSGVVQAVRSPDGLGYPTQQCGVNTFARVPWAVTSRAVCPDGTAPLSGLCNLPYRPVAGGGRDFNCINRANSRPPSLPSVDGRVYNSVIRNSAGTVRFVGTGRALEATFRQDMVNIDNGFGAVNGKTYAATDAVCQQPDATRQIACLTARNNCSAGIVNRAASVHPAFGTLQEPLNLNGTLPTVSNVLNGVYPLSMGIYIAAIGGFETLNADCEARGHRALPGASDYCYAQFEVAAAAYAMPDNVVEGFEAVGLISVPPDYPGRCVGALASAGCGAPVVQDLIGCRPTRPSDRDIPDL